MAAIIKVTEADIAQAVALVNTAYRGEESKQGWTTESHLLEGVRIDEEEMLGYLHRPEITLLKYVNDDGRMDGFVYLEQIKHNRIYLGMISVRPNLQAAGIGRKLLEAGDEHARQLGCEAVKISVITTRTELIAWYERRGYAHTGKTMPLVTDKSVAKEPVTLMVMEKMVE